MGGGGEQRSLSPELRFPTRLESPHRKRGMLTTRLSPTVKSGPTGWPFVPASGLALDFWAHAGA